MGDGNQRARLEALAERLGRHHISFLPPAPADEYPSVLAAADALLVHQRATVSDMSLPGKISNYFAAGRPIIVAVSEGSATAAEARASGACLMIPPEDPSALVEAACKLATDRQLAGRLASRGPAYESSRLRRGESLDINRFVATLVERR